MNNDFCIAWTTNSLELEISGFASVTRIKQILHDCFLSTDVIDVPKLAVVLLIFNCSGYSTCEGNDKHDDYAFLCLGQ